ncbi:MAG TPA: nucleotidyl transferase AbiEii/AbiGii toxin family protein [Mycobacterium sp.]|jgi:predicted nucleotidyltransferase component of viral defense system|nr:nucleotidyl transferase AbiEii/AbiGii toxin family protein [Mycobacterium sp.]
MNADERAEIAQRFGVAPEQVERDHLISHLLAFLGQNLNDRIQFIGGTALARTHLPDGRLSEDIDLIAIDDRKTVAADLDAALPRALARTHGRLILDPPLSAVANTVAAILRSATGMVVRIQLLSARGRVSWPTECRTLEQRYRDAPAAELLVPTLPAFAASKTGTWADRRAPRDLWDLWALSRIGAIDAAALELYRRFGPTNQPPGDYVFETPPSEDEWRSQLAGQTRLTVDAAHALAVVRDAWARVVAADRGN